jgi:hypothetical protein
MKHIKLYESFDNFPTELKYLFNHFTDEDRYYTNFILASEDEDYGEEYQVHVSFDDYTDQIFMKALIELFGRLYTIGDFEFRIQGALCSTTKVHGLKVGTNHSSNFYNISDVQLSDITDLLWKELKASQNIDRIDDNQYETGVVFFFDEEFLNSI